MKRSILKLSIFTFSVFLLWTVVYGLSAIYAAVPHLINYQGQLTDKNDTPLTGAQNITFRIYDAETAGTMLWEEPHTDVIVEQGIVSIMLGSITALNLPFDKAYFLELKVGNEVMSPRQRMSSVGYAIRAEDAEKAVFASNADTVDGFHASSTPSANKILVADSNAKLPTQALKVYDSGWFPVTKNQIYTKIHNLGTANILVTVWANISPSETNAQLINSQLERQNTDMNDNAACGVRIDNINVISLYTGNELVAYTMNFSSGEPTIYRSGYYKIIILGF